MLELDKLPEKYRYNDESLLDGVYIDDNSLFLYQCLARGRFSGGSPEMNFLYFKPFEWTTCDFIAFLLSASKQYGLEVQNIKTNMLPIAEDYEVELFEENGQPIPSRIAEYADIVGRAMMTHNKKESFVQPKWYEGGYKWILDKRTKNDKSEEVELFEKFSNDMATVADIERLMIYANRSLSLYEKRDTENYMSKDLFGNILDWTTFSLAITPAQKEKIDTDIDSYIEAFIQSKLGRNTKTKKIAGTQVSQSENIFTFKKHTILFRDYLQKMYEDFGNNPKIENIFEEPFPNYSFPNGEAVRIRYADRNFFFIHVLFAFEKMGFIKILSLGSNWDYHEDKPLSYETRVGILEAFLNEEAGKILAFDLDKSRFYVQGKVIKLLKFKDEYHTLRVMFENPDELAKEWFFSEIAERIDQYKIDDKKYYNAVYQLKLKLEKEGIKDFFITTKQSAKISPKYLS